MQAAIINIDDDTSSIRAFDPSGMGQHIAAFPEQLTHGWNGVAALPLPAEEHRAVRHIVVQGMGGSAIAGDIGADAMSLLREPGETGPRIDVHRDYGAHPSVGPGTLVIIMSHSGHTEEALSGLRASRELGAQVITLTGGGPLADAAADHGIPVVMMPENGGPPRASLPYALGALLRILVHRGLGPAKTEHALADAVAALETRQRAFAAADTDVAAADVNPAMTVARDLAGQIPVIVSGQGLTSAARRWKTQLNENAKTPAWTEELPEMHHNAIVGFERHALTDGLAVVLLGPVAAHATGQHDRYAISRLVLSDLGVPTYWPDLVGETPLSRLLEAVLLGDYVSYYLAVMSGVDPMPTTSLDNIKQEIRRANQRGGLGR